MPKQIQTFDDATRKIAKLVGKPGATKRTQTGSVGDAGATGAQRFVNPMSALGDLIQGGVAGAMKRLGIGTQGQVLSVVDVSGDLVPRWSSYLDVIIQATPATPPVGYVRLYAKSDKRLYAKDSDGTETALW